MGARSTPRRRLSLLRLVVVLVVLAGAGVGAYAIGARAVEQLQSPDPAAFFAPYVDVTLVPELHFEDPLESPASTFALGFVVADPTDGCEPSWGTYYDLDAAGKALDLDRRIARLRQRGGDVVVSFGGAANFELALTCTDAGALRTAYAAVVDRYELAAIDLDIEGAALDDAAAVARRAEAVAAVQTDHPGLDVWLTLPVTPQGLLDNAAGVLDRMLAAGIDLAGVNIMTMDYGASRGDLAMRDATESAIEATRLQLDAAYRRAGQVLSPEQVGRRLGVTPMIGLNDVEGEVFTLADAEWLLHHAAELGLGRISMWSANRDSPCGPQVDGEGPSNTCSGVDQEPLAFSYRFAELIARPATVTPPDTSLEPADGARDDPQDSPYPIWRTGKQYQQGDKVVWHRGVYEAKWWTEGDQPDAAVEHLWDTPWRYLGPVLASDATAPVRTASDADRPEWNADRVYLKGDEVVHDGFAFRARWWTQAEEPDPDPDRPSDVPWEVLGAVDPSPDGAGPAAG